MGTFVLVHGAFRGAWSWQRVAGLLRAHGHQVHTPTLTGQGELAHLLAPWQNVDTYADDVTATLVMHDLRGVTLVAHSFAGFPVTVAAERESARVARIVYLDAVVPDDGQANADVSPAAVPGWVSSAAADGWRVAPPPVDVLDVNPLDREFVRSRLRPMPLAAFLQRVHLGGHDSRIARDLVVATGWAASPFRRQAPLLRGRPGWTVTEIGTGHEVMLDAPEWVAGLLSAEGRAGR